MNIVHQINKTRGVRCRSYNKSYPIATVLKVHAAIVTTSVRKMFVINSKYLIVC